MPENLSQSFACTTHPVHPAIELALNYLAGRCNYAATRDNAGFNGADTERGHFLADCLPNLTKDQQFKAIAMLRKYQNTQLAQAAIELPTDLELAAFLRDNLPKPLKRLPVIPEVLPGITLNAGQWQALQELESFVQGKHQKLHLLTGFAGCGKTLLVQALIQRLRDKGDYRSIVFSAFSNKATKVLAKMVDRWNLSIECMTCCKLLGLKPDIDESTGKQYFRRDVKEDNKFDRFDLVVVDEASMISEEMWRLLTDQVANLYASTQILFVGDVAQLPPVNERESKCFTEILSSSSLTEVVRYGGSIGVLAESLRNRLDYVQFPPFVTDTNDDRTEGTFVLSPSQWEQSLLKAFSSDAYKRDSDYVRALAYTNKRVDSLNQKVRAQLYGDAAPRFTVNERLMANAPVYIKDSVVLENSAECEVLDVREGRSGSWTVWYLQVKTDDDRIKTLEVLHESERVRFARQLKEYSDSKRWREFWELKQIFADVSYAYAITVHKSQGSTFQNVFVDIGNISTNRNIRERNQLAYVGCTRAANRLFICQ